MTPHIKAIEWFNIAGRGTVVAINNDDLPPDLKLNVGDNLYIDEKLCKLVGVEMSSGIGKFKNQGLVVRLIEENPNAPKKMLILIGLPGSGKSTTAKQLVADAVLAGSTALICSTDDFFIREDGSYRFDWRKFQDYHVANRNKAEKACQDQINLIIIDNTNIKKSHRKEYEIIAERYGYDVETIIAGDFTKEFAEVCAARNIHTVPLKTILKMARQVELPGKEIAGSKV